MSETEKVQNCTMESEDTCPKDLEQDNPMEHSKTSNYSESQDFHLVDFDDNESLDKSADNLEETKSEETSCRVIDNMESSLNATETMEIEDKATRKDQEDKIQMQCTESQGITKKEDPCNDVASTLEVTKEKESCNDIGNTENKSKESEEEEDIIECTPPDVYSPSKKEVPSNTATTNMKRKADSFDEPPHKILRTTSMEDVSIAEKKVLEKEESCHSVKSDDSHHELVKDCDDKDVIIAETQEVTQDEDIDDMLEETSKDEEKTMDSEKHSNSQTKEDEINKNENFNDILKLNDAISSKEHNKDTSDAKDIVQSSGNVSSSVQTKETDNTSPSKKVVLNEIIKSNSNNSSTDDIQLSENSDNCVKDIEKTVDKENGIETTKHIDFEQTSNDAQEASIPKKTINEPHSNMNSTNVCNSRMSIELIYDKTMIPESKTKSKELVQIDEDGEKIVLDSSQEDSDGKPENPSILDNTKSETIYKSCYDSKSSSDFSYKSLETPKESSLDTAKSSNKLVNGSNESKRFDLDSTASVKSDTFNDMPIGLDNTDNNSSTSVHNLNRQNRTVAPVSKDSDHAELLSVSDNEPDVFILDDKSKSNLAHSVSMTKPLSVEKEIGMYVRMKCVLNIDEGTKEFLSKEITGVQCETVAEPSLVRQKNNDTSASLADISGNDNKDTSPGSVNSNPHLYQLNPSRLSFASTISSTSSISSAASMAAKLAIRDSTHFSLPRGPAKHAKKHAQDIHSSNDKLAIEEAYDRLSKEWQNSHLLTTTILNFANAELSGVDTYNVSNERIDDQLQKIRSSTPEVLQEMAQVHTPKSSKKSKSVKRSRSKSTKSDNQSNGLNKVLSKVLIPAESNNTPNKKKTKIEHVDNALSSVDVSIKTPLQVVTDDLIGKEVFAKWSDNNYYPGTVIDKVKTKYKVNFYDGKSKVLIEDFIITIPKVLKEGFSVYATTKNDDYGSCGIIVDSQTVNNEIYYVVETDEGDKVRVQIKDIFLSSDQAQVLKEELNSESKSLPSTPKHLGQVTLDNMVDGKRRSRRIATPSFSTPKSRLTITPKTVTEPSVSGVASIPKEIKGSFESDGISTDSNVSIKEETSSIGVQPEIIGTPYEQIVKGPQSRIKSKSRSKKKVEDEETIATLGPIPSTDSNLFKGMSFILTCASLETIDRYQADSKDCNSDPETEYEEEWTKKPFVRDRLNTQIIAGGGKVYTDFNEIPQDEYKSTKLITNVPNTTAKTLLCLSVGIPAYNHNWIIRCCQEGKIVNPAEDELPVGWSLDKKSYVDMFQRSDDKPLKHVVVIIPVLECEKQFTILWRQICENAGAVVLLVDKPDAMESFVEGTVVLTNASCPSWAIGKANELQIPLLSTTWVIQCLIEGKLCQHDSHLRYKYNYIQN
ncbi:uncharacterized protein LOC128878885 [Hylaeus volcanicus]|uniref:uncharacterized protein LOC128878885 n=1 Tax=Hylaeus volcanicus TaxID=313075 RepID=UPI0023B8739A|nr:uncharacterized protein LOC128878885 [Hylaeus volcanicus]XP_053983486.1 uncharacterized protein LOC128878885 [Hylaeus volcanicus]